jgi:hypothetical protein
VSLRGSFEVTPGGAKPRRNGARVDAERIRDLDGGELLELGQNEHLALVVVELLEKLLHEPHCFCFGERFVRPEVARIGEGLGVGVREVDMGTFATRGPSVLANDAHEDRKDPRFNRAATAWKVVEPEIGEASVGNQKDMLNHIVDCGIVHPKPSRSAPNELDVRMVKIFETVAFCRAGLRRHVVVGYSHNSGPGRHHRCQLQLAGHTTFHC